MDKKTKQLLMIGGGLALLYYFKNRPAQNTPATSTEPSNQGDYAGGGGVDPGAIPSQDFVGSGYVASGDDDTDSIANDPSTTYTGAVVRPYVYTPPIVGGKGDGISGRPVVGVANTANKLPSGRVPGAIPPPSVKPYVVPVPTGGTTVYSGGR
jgi:hypothetical protein